MQMQMNSQNKGQKGVAKTGDKRKSSQAHIDNDEPAPKSSSKRQRVVQEDEPKASYHSEDDDADMGDIPIN